MKIVFPRLMQTLIAVAMVSLLAACTFGRQQPAPADALDLPLLQTPVIEQEVAAVQRGDVAATLEFDGQVELAQQADLFFGQTGRVRAVNVVSGDTVAPGDLIAELDTRTLDFDRQAAELNLALARERLDDAQALRAFELQEAQLAVEIAELRLQAYAQLDAPDQVELEIRGRAVTQAQLALQQVEEGLGSNAAADVRRNETDVALAELALARLDASLTDSQLIAPFAGEVRLFADLEVGRVATGYETVAQVVDPASFRITANVVRADLERLYEGMPVQLKLPSRLGFTADATITTLPQPFGSGTGGSVLIALDDPADTMSLREGSSVRAVAELSRSEDTLWLPVRAVRGFGRNRFVLINNNGTIQEIPVTVGAVNSDQVELIDGVFEGMEVLIQ
jgi:multidrug efflux pump subunit AcrA (membrane-fusion protein)